MCVAYLPIDWNTPTRYLLLNHAICWLTLTCHMDGGNNIWDVWFLHVFAWKSPYFDGQFNNSPYFVVENSPWGRRTPRRTASPSTGSRMRRPWSRIPTSQGCPTGKSRTVGGRQRSWNFLVNWEILEDSGWGLEKLDDWSGLMFSLRVVVPSIFDWKLGTTKFIIVPMNIAIWGEIPHLDHLGSGISPVASPKNSCPRSWSPSLMDTSSCALTALFCAASTSRLQWLTGAHSQIREKRYR